jgi:hypothetical protein
MSSFPLILAWYLGAQLAFAFDYYACGVIDKCAFDYLHGVQWAKNVQITTAVAIFALGLEYRTRKNL